MPTPLTDADKVLRNDTGKDIVEKLDDIAQALGVGVNADQINYDNTTSGLESTDVQDAIDEVKEITDDLDDKLDGLTNIISTASGAIAIFNDGGDNIPVKSLETDIVATQSGTGTPSPSNPRAISLFDSIDLPVSSRNLFDIAALNKDDVTVSNGVASGTAEAFHNAFSSGSIMVVPKTQIVFSFYAYTDQSASSTGNGLRSRIVYTDGTSDDVYCPNSTTSYTRFTIISNAEKTPSRLTFTYSSGKNNTWYVKDVQLELGNEATTYEAYKGTTHIMPLGQTIAGGTAELVGGNGVKDYGYILLNGTENWSEYTAQNGFSINLTDSVADSIDMMCNYFPIISTVANFGLRLTQSQLRFCHITDNISGVTNLATWKTWLSNNNVQVVYPLAAPVTISFTPEQIPTLSGLNNIYSNTGDVAVEYFNSKADWLADLIRAMTR